MSNCLFCYPDRTLRATSVSGGSFSASFPLSNIQNDSVQKVARSTDTTIINTQFNIAITESPLKLVALINTNLSSNALVRIIVKDSTNTYITYDTLDFSVSHSEISASDISEFGLRFDVFKVLPDNISGGNVSVYITDTGNSSGYVEFGRCLLMPAWTPNVNLDFGNGFVYSPNVTVDKNVEGVRFYEKYKSVRVTNGKLSGLTDDEATYAIMQMQQKLSISSELFFVYDPDETNYYKQQRSYLATFEELSPLEQPYIDNYSWPFKLCEKI